jgi:SSS family solute:Na+ symporter
MSQNFWIAIFSWCACFLVTVLVSVATVPRPVKDLEGLVYGLAPLPGFKATVWYRRPAMLAGIALAVWALLNVAFW